MSSSNIQPGKPVSDADKERLIAEGRMSSKELADAKLAYSKGDYAKAAHELADAAKYGIEHGVDAAKQAMSGKSEASSVSNLPHGASPMQGSSSNPIKGSKPVGQSEVRPSDTLPQSGSAV